MDLLRNTVEDMALWFPRVRRLNLSIERPSQIVSLIRIPSLQNTQYALQKYPEFAEFTEILSFVTELTYLHFLLWERTATLFNGSGVLANDGKMAQAKAWGLHVLLSQKSHFSTASRSRGIITIQFGRFKI